MKKHKYGKMKYIHMSQLSFCKFSIFITFTFIIVGFNTANCQNQKTNCFSQCKYDYQLSPYTGYTRDHWLEITEQIILGMLPHLDEETGMPYLDKKRYDYGNLVYNDSREEKRRALERSMMAVVIYTTATGKDTISGYGGSISAPYIKAILKGTNPDDSAFWGDPVPFDQVGSIFALAVYLNPELFWEPLSISQKHNILNYLQKQAFNQTYDNNHHTFHMVSVPLLEKYGLDANRNHLTKMFSRLLGWYRGNGWFIDGSNQGFDYYNLWGFQLYLQVLCRFDVKWNQQFGDRVDHIANNFFETLPFLLGRDGGSIPWGRSLCYRFASNSAIAWAVLNGNCTLQLGQSRRIASGVLKYFWENGCMDDENLLTIGFRGANASVAEDYISPGDPYWAVHGLSCLLIPEEDPFWNEVEKPIPADEDGGEIAVPGAQFSIRVSPIDGEARLYPAGQPFKHDRKYWQIGTKYDQYSYSSYLGFCTTGEGGNEVGAGRVGFSFDGTNWKYTERALPIKVKPNHTESKYLLKSGDYNEIIRHTLIGKDGEIHIIWHNNPEPLYLFVGGYGISVAHNHNFIKETTKSHILINSGEYYSLIQNVNKHKGVFGAELLNPVDGWEHTHLFGGKGAYTFWKSQNMLPPLDPIVIYTNGTKNREALPAKIKLIEYPGQLKIQFEGEWFEVETPY